MSRNSDGGLGLSDVYIWFSYTTGNMLRVNAYNTPTKYIVLKNSVDQKSIFLGIKSWKLIFKKS